MCGDVMGPTVGPLDSFATPVFVSPSLLLPLPLLHAPRCSNHTILGPRAELLEGEEGFALSQGTWQRDGWRELDDLRKKLEGLKELRELVRGLGRSGGKGPLRKAPEQVGGPVGVLNPVAVSSLLVFAVGLPWTAATCTVQRG